MTIAGERLLRFVVLGDSHIEPEPDPGAQPRSNERLRRLVEEINRVRPAFAVHLGDLAHPVPSQPAHGPAQAVARAILDELACPLHVTAGNHDIGDKPLPWMPAKRVTADWLDGFEQRYARTWSRYEAGGVRFLLVNSPILNSGLAAEADQRVWLEHELTEACGRTFLLTHYPPFLLEPDEPSSYDNLDEPGRGWLLGLIAAHGLEAVFAGHVHMRFRDRLGPTSFWTAPATGFVRRDYSELFRVGPAAEFGRDDAGKLGFLMVDVFERGHRVGFRRLDDAAVAPAPPGRLGVFLRHPWTEPVDIPCNPPTDALTRRRARNDQPLLALGELALGPLRVPISDLRDPAVRERMVLLGHDGHRFVVTGHGLPAAADLALLGRHRELIRAYEAVLPLGDARRLRPDPASPAPVSLRLAPLITSADLPEGGPSTNLVDAGFSPAQLDLLSELGLYTVGLFEGPVVRVGLDQANVFEAILKIANALWARELEGSVSVSLLGATPEAAQLDDGALAGRIAQAAFAALACPEVDVILDTLIDVDRGYYPRHGLLDRRGNLRLQGRIVRAMTRLPGLRANGRAWSLRSGTGQPVHGFESEDGVLCLMQVDGPPGPLPLPGYPPERGQGLALLPAEGSEASFTWRTLPGDPPRLDLALPELTSGPVLLRFPAA